MNYQNKSFILVSYYEESIKSILKVMENMKDISLREKTILNCLDNTLKQKPHQILKK